MPGTPWTTDEITLLKVAVSKDVHLLDLHRKGRSPAGSPSSWGFSPSSWVSIAQEVGKTVKECQTKWPTLTKVKDSWVPWLLFTRLLPLSISSSK